MAKLDSALAIDPTNIKVYVEESVIYQPAKSTMRFCLYSGKLKNNPPSMRLMVNESDV